MHKLNRDIFPPPESLARYDYRVKSWCDFRAEDKSQLRSALVQMQGIPDVTTEEASEYGVRCAYCEGAIHHEGHIEHFRRKNAAYFPELTFVWSNLFLACGSKQHCGHYKDRPSGEVYDPINLIKPDIHDPDLYLFFHSSGHISPRSGLEPADMLKATETIRVFGLDKGTLPSDRARAVKVYKDRVLSDLDDISSWGPELITEYLEQEISNTQWQPFATTIKHFLLSYF